MRKTSLQSWKEMNESGLITKRQLDVLIVLEKEGMLSGQELSQKVLGGWKRLSELERHGLVIGDILGKCSITGRMVTQWRLA